jgi:DNA-binding MarR family transcriptional regulator
MSDRPFNLILGALGWMKKCFGGRLSIQEMMVGMCIWKLTHESKRGFTTQDVVDDLSIPYSTATRLLRNWAERGVIEPALNLSDDTRKTGYQLTERGIKLGDILRQWNQGDDSMPRS